MSVSGGGYSHSERGRSLSISPPPSHVAVKVVGLSKNVESYHLSEIFGFYGRVERVVLPLDRTSGENMGFAHVVYGRAEEAQRAVGHMDKGQIDGRILSVRLDAPPPERDERRRERDRHGYARRHADRWEPSRGTHAAHTRWQPRNRDSQPDREPPRAGSDPAHRPRRRTPSPPHRHRRPSPEYGHAYAPRRRSRSRSPPPPRRTSPTYD